MALRLVILSSALAVGLIIFWPAVYKVGYGVLHRQGSSHGVFIPFFSAYFIYLNWNRLKTLPIEYWRPAVVPMVFCIFFPRLLPGALELQFIVFLIFISLTVCTCLGKLVFRTVLFPILFAITMVPIPPDLYDLLADVTRRITFNTSLIVLSLLDIPYYKEGWLIKLPNALLEVAISCSGIRYLISYFVFGIAYAYLYRKTTLGRAFLVMATIPISLIASALRLTIIFLATYFISPRLAEYWPHVFLSWCIFFMVLFCLIFLDQRLLDKRNQNRKLDVTARP